MILVKAYKSETKAFQGEFATFLITLQFGFRNYIFLSLKTYETHNLTT